MYQPQDLLGGQELLVGRQWHALLGHTVEAPQIAALRQRDPEVGVLPPAGRQDAQAIGEQLRGNMAMREVFRVIRSAQGQQVYLMR